MSLLDSMYAPPAYDEVDELETALQEAYETGLSDGYNEVLNELSAKTYFRAGNKLLKRSADANSNAIKYKANGNDPLNPVHSAISSYSGKRDAIRSAKFYAAGLRKAKNNIKSKIKGFFN